MATAPRLAVAGWRRPVGPRVVFGAASDADLAGADGGAQPVDELGPPAGDQGQADRDEQGTAEAGDPGAVAAGESAQPQQVGQAGADERQPHAQRVGGGQGGAAGGGA